MIPGLAYFTKYTQPMFMDYYARLWGYDRAGPSLRVVGEAVIDSAWADYSAIKEKVLANKVLFNFISVEHPELSGTYFYTVDQTFQKITDDISANIAEYYTCQINSLNPALATISNINTFKPNEIKWIGVYGTPDFIAYGTRLTIDVSNTDMFVLKTLAYSDVNQYAPYYGNNPLLLSVAKGWNHENSQNNKYTQQAIIRALLSCPSLDVNAIDLKNGMTALHLACLRADSPELIQLLLDKGAVPSLKDRHNRTPVDLLNTSYEEAKKYIEQYTGGCLQEIKRSRKSMFPVVKEGTASLLNEASRQSNIEAIGLLLRTYSAEKVLSDKP